MSLVIESETIRQRAGHLLGQPITQVFIVNYKLLNRSMMKLKNPTSIVKPRTTEKF